MTASRRREAELGIHRFPETPAADPTDRVAALEHENTAMREQIEAVREVVTRLGAAFDDADRHIFLPPGAAPYFAGCAALMDELVAALTSPPAGG